MSGSKRDRQRAGRQARMAAAAAAARRRAMRRRLIFGAVAAAAIVLIAFLISLTGGDDGTQVGSQGSTTTTPTTAATVATDSAAGKPCVAVVDPLPAGAPAIPVKVGPAPTTLITEDLKVGTGPTVTANATITVNYIGATCSTGKIFDSSYMRGQPATFPLSGVIKGWGEGIPGMKVGGQRLLGIPADKAYGPTGSPPTIGPNEPLWFVVEVLDITA